MENQFSERIVPDTYITRINGSLLSQFIGSMVSIVGTVESVNGAMVTLHTSDDKSVTLNAPMGFQYSQGKVVEVIGTVDNNCSITIRVVTPFDVPSYNTNGYNKLVEYMNGKFKQVFC